MTKGNHFEKRGKCKHGNCCLIGKAAWTDLTNDCTVLELHNMCVRSGCKCQKQLKTSPKLYMLDSGSIEFRLKKKSNGTGNAWNKFLKPVLKIASPYIPILVRLFLLEQKSSNW